MALLEIENLSKSFGGIKAVRDCTFSVEKGTITALIGPNGAGKTTVFNLITGLLKPDTGSMKFHGEELVGKPPHQITRKGISRTFQITRNLKEMTVLENLAIQRPVHGIKELFMPAMSKAERDRALDLLEFLGIDHLTHEKTVNLSFGQKKLVELATVLMSDPELIMLDEPAGGVNPALLETIIERIQDLNQQGITFLIVEHNMDMVMDISDPVVCMAYGSVLAQGGPDNIQNNPKVLEAYLGD